MNFTNPFNRHSRRGLLIEFNPYQILAAGISHMEKSPVTLDCAVQFDCEDDAGLRQWLNSNFETLNYWVPALCGFAPPEGLLQRESLQARKLDDPAYLEELVREQYKIENPERWKIGTLSPQDGTALGAEGGQRPAALICGVSHTSVHFLQQRCLDHRLMPYRIEQSVLSLLGSIADFKARRDDKSAIVVVVIEQEHTTAFILGKEGLHTPAPVRRGFSSIVQAARIEFGLHEAAKIRYRLNLADEEFMLRAPKLVRAIGRDLKQQIDSYEMTTGQPVEGLYYAYLPPSLSWIAEALTHVVERKPFTMDCQTWLPTVNIQVAEGVPPFDSHWLGALSLIASSSPTKPDEIKG